MKTTEQVGSTKKRKSQQFLFSPMAITKFPDPLRCKYFNDEDHLAACERNNVKRVDYDKFNRNTVISTVSRGLLGRPVVIFGVEYKTVSAAAKHFGVCTATIRYRILSDLERWSEWRYR